MLFAFAYIITEPDSFSHIPNTQLDSLKQKNVMHETIYYENYEALKSPGNAVVIYPIFTQSAYEWNGIHDFNLGRCDSCNTVEIQTSYEKLFSASANGFVTLEFLGYEIINDFELSQDPSILEQYDKVILLHNEFVSKAEFDAISNHPNVVYLYPNALSSEVTVNYSDNTITLVRGPNYPNNGINNGFDWEFDNSEQLNNLECNDWNFEKIDNGYMLNCYPEQFLLEHGYGILKTLRDL